MTPALRIRLLGEFQIDYDGKPLAGFSSARLQSLLAYLLLHRDAPQPRAHVAFQIWPDTGESQAQANLRYFLHQLRRALPDAGEFIRADKTTIQWNAEAVCAFDVADFERALAPANRPETVQAQALEQSLAQYTGDLLPSCYDDWIVPERERLRDLSLQAAERLGGLYEQRENYTAAIGCFQRLLRQDPLRESTYRHLMQLHVLTGDRAGALRVYCTCVTVLKRELDVEPSQATQETYERLIQTKSQPAAAAPVFGATSFPSPNLPLQPTSFIGRVHELAEIRRLLSRTRLLTVTGAGGSGKSRLVLGLAAEFSAAQAHTGGVTWVELATIADPMLVPQVVATALGLREEPGQPLVETLTAHLHAKTLLLVLDNGEHLVDACAQLAGRLLRFCPNLTLVFTSRTALGIAGETTWQVPLLSLPPETSEFEFSHANTPRAGAATQGSAPITHDLAQSESVRLFVDRAASVLPTFRLTERNAAAVAQICRRLDGIPLAIELAAARVKLLTVEQIAGRLDDALRLLRGSSRSAPPRHQTLQAAIDWSYQLLTAGEQALFRRLSVFAGSFVLEAAETVCSSPPARGEQQADAAQVNLLSGDILDLLSGLIDQSLVVAVEQEHGRDARYRLLETIRQYGRAKLQDPGEWEFVRRQYADYYLNFAERTAQQFKGRDQVEWVERLEAENDNLRAALEWAIEQREAELGLRLASAIWRFWFARGYLSEGRDWLARLFALTHGVSYTLEYATAAYGAGVIAWRQGRHAEARVLGKQSVGIYRMLEDGEGIGLSLLALANASGADGAYVEQRAYLEESLALFRELGDKSGAAGSLNNLGELSRFVNDFAQAEPYYVESLGLYQAMGNTNGAALVQHNLALVALHEGEYSRAASLLRDSLSTYNAFGHRTGIAMCLSAVACLCAAGDQFAASARLFAAAAALQDTIGAVLDGADAAARDLYLARARAQLSETTSAEAWAAGAALPPDAAVAAALSALNTL